MAWKLKIKSSFKKTRVKFIRNSNSRKIKWKKNQNQVRTG